MKHPGEDVPPLSSGEIFGLAAAGGVLGIIVIIVLLAVFISARKKKQLYLDFANRQLKLSLSWRGVGCTIVSKKQELRILRDMSGVAKPGTLTAFLG